MTCGRLVLGTVICFALTGCGVPGAIELSGADGGLLLRQEGPVTGDLTICGSRTETFDVTIVEVRADTILGTEEPVEFFVDWAGAPDDLFGDNSAPPPASFEPATGATGRVGDCDDGEGARIAFVTPAVGAEPNVVGDFVIVYESDGEEARTSSAYAQVQCPLDQKVDTHGCDER